MRVTVRNYEIHAWEDLITGVVLAEDNDWILLHELPSDYTLDGYLLVNKSQISEHFADDDSEQKALVLKLRNYKPTLPEGFELGRIEDMLRYIENKFHLFGIQDEEDILRVGFIQSMVANELRLHHIAPDGIPDPSIVMPIFFTDIQTVSFNTDYLNAVYLLHQHEGA